MRYSQPNSVFTRRLQLPVNKKRGGLVLLGAILGIAIPVAVRIYLQYGSEPESRYSPQHLVDETSLGSSEQSGTLATTSVTKTSRASSEQAREAPSRPQARSAVRNSSSWKGSAETIDVRNIQPRVAATINDSRPSPVAATRRAGPSQQNPPIRSVQRQVPIVHQSVSRQQIAVPGNTMQNTQQNSRVAMIEPTTPAPPPQPASRFVSDLRLTYSTALVERCAASCIMLFRDPQGTMLRGSYPRSQFQATLLQSGGEANFSGFLTVRQSQAWLEITTVTSLRSTAVAEAVIPAQLPTESSPITPVSSQTASKASPPPRYAPPSEPAQSVSPQENEAGMQRFQNRLRKVRGVPNQRVSLEDTVEVGNEGEEPYSNFHQRLRRSTGN